MYRYTVRRYPYVNTLLDPYVCTWYTYVNTLLDPYEYTVPLRQYTTRPLCVHGTPMSYM